MEKEKTKTPRFTRDLLHYSLLILVMMVAAYFRFTGVEWDSVQYLHPDERFLFMVESGIQPVNGGLGEYFNTEISTLNPNNQGFPFFVYGTFPIILSRYVGEWIGNIGSYGGFHLVGRPLSGFADLIAVFVVYLLAAKVYNRRVGLFAAALSALTVLQIQLSHFFAVDTFKNLFMLMAVYFAALLMVAKWREDSTRQPAGVPAGQPLIPLTSQLKKFFAHPAFWPSIWFGAALGLAVASKVDSVVVAAVLPAAGLIYLSQVPAKALPKEVVLTGAFMAAGAVVSMLVFRIFQPYAFEGPGFFNFSLNELWLNNLQSLQAQAKPDSGFPPSIQWFDRPLWFSGRHLFSWGVGWPMAVAAITGFGWMAWRMYRNNEWRAHILLWGWAAAYFTWQSFVWNRTMRYQLPVYPFIAIFAAWAIVRLWDLGKENLPRLRSLVRPLALASGVTVIFGTFLWAYAFSQIYTRPITRLSATQWIYANMPGPISLEIDTNGGSFKQPIPVPNAMMIRAEQPFETFFDARTSGTLTEISLHKIYDDSASALIPPLSVSVYSQPLGEGFLGSAALEMDPASLGVIPFSLTFPNPIPMTAEEMYFLRFELLEDTGDIGDINICGSMSIRMETLSGPSDQSLLTIPGCTLTFGEPYEVPFSSVKAGMLSQVVLSSVSGQFSQPESKAFTVRIYGSPDKQDLRGEGTVTADTVSKGHTIRLNTPVNLVEGTRYYLSLALDSGGGQVSITGADLANETTWDDGLPLRWNGYDGFGGIFQGHNLEMYWPDDQDKVERINGILNDADAILISSSRQWASLTRLPEKYPLTTEYYRNLMGCPANRTVEWCYNTAQVGMFDGTLGFELAAVFDSSPNLGSYVINDQFSEEAFTVYDHPKVFIFLKSEDYDAAAVRDILTAAGLADPTVPAVATDAPPEVSNLLLPADRAETQFAGGTFNEIFNADSIVNRFQPLTVVIWYLAVTMLGLAAYPIVRIALPGLPDRGYPLIRTAGLLFLSYIMWIGASTFLTFERVWITVVVLVLVLIGGLLAFVQRDELSEEWRTKRNYFLAVEALAVGLFVFFLLIRLGNPDLWHPWKGGEKPMDFSYFNAVLKSTTFPPYDPWFSGGYINYYYYGFVYVGVVVKWLGILPALAYNLILPTLFSMTGLGAFSVGWNLIKAREKDNPEPESDEAKPGSFIEKYRPYLVGGAALLGVTVLGNFGTLRMIFQGYQRISAPPGTVFTDHGVIQRWIWAAQGLFQTMKGASLPYSVGDWYWLPSRAIPAPGDVEPITEFPFFTFLYADLHAHMIALPITLLALAWAVSVVLGRGWHHRVRAQLEGSSWVRIGTGLLLGGLTIGALRPTNTWDFPTYLVLGAAALFYVASQYEPAENGAFSRYPKNIVRGVMGALGAGALVGLSFLLYKPFSDWYVLGYTEAGLWTGGHTPLSAYLTHWGLFLFVIVSWMAWETREWLATTPVSALRRLRPREVQTTVLVSVLIVILWIAWLFFIEVEIGWFVLPLAVWAALLLFRPGISEARRFVLFLVGTGLILSLSVEVVVLSGDIGRMNTVFKFYLQVWIMFAVSAAAALGWLLPEFRKWIPNVRATWALVFTAMVFIASLYPITGGLAKIRDRMAVDSPTTLDGMAYMPLSTYGDQGRTLTLDEDYNAILWMQQNVEGTPTIVEANIVEYRWGNRYTVYTGLPNVLGWNWHQRQQRAFAQPLAVENRLAEIELFYRATDQESLQTFLETYHVGYIIVGQLERAYYDGPGIDKFETYNGTLWDEVYRDGDTVIYQVDS